jgi:NAD(P)-dependent dehydrogenase (short-subunit alcohol dehydrogenase family)
VCEPGAERRIASFTSVSGPNLDHLGKWVRKRLSKPTPRNVAGPLAQLMASGYTAFFQMPVLPRGFFGLVANEHRWKRFLKLVEGTPPKRVHLGPTFRHDMVSGLRIYRANIVPLLRRPRERRTVVPVQLIVDTRDMAVRAAGFEDEHLWTARLWRRDIPAGHWSPFSHPQVLANSVIELIDTLNGAEAPRALRRAEVRPNRNTFADQLVVITGAGSGIGRETALAFARLGAEVVVCDVNLASADETAALVAEAGAIAFAYEVNVADEAQVQAFADTVISKHGVPDILINNAGIGHAGRFLDTPSAEFQRILDVNLNGVIYGCRAFAQSMVARGTGGHIVNLSSMAAFAPQQSMGPYSTSKAAVFMFSDCLRAELAHSGIGVSTICPGVVRTNIVATTTFSGVGAEEQASRQAKFDRLYQKRNYTPDRVATQIVRAVVRNRAIVPVTAESHQSYYLSRIAPGISRRLARLNLL